MSTISDESLKDKCKRLQKECDYKIDTDKYVLVHIDGRSFSTKIKKRFKRPFDNDFIKMMDKTAVYLCENTQGARMAYVQSDEISLLLRKANPKGDIFFSGRLCKMQSIIASMATAIFNSLMVSYRLLNQSEGVAGVVQNPSLYNFDCKVWAVDSINDAMAWFLFRNIDCVRNSKEQLAQTYYSHRQLLNFTCDEQIGILKKEKDINWHDFPEGHKYGRMIYPEEYLYTRELPENDDSVTETTFVRKRWTIHDGMDLTNPENREKLKKII